MEKLIYIFKLLCLGITGQDCDVVSVVASGDSCTTIADAAGIPLSTLLNNNPNVNSQCSNIYPGEVKISIFSDEFKRSVTDSVSRCCAPQASFSHMGIRLP